MDLLNKCLYRATTTVPHSNKSFKSESTDSNEWGFGWWGAGLGGGGWVFVFCWLERQPSRWPHVYSKVDRDGRAASGLFFIDAFQPEKTVETNPMSLRGQGLENALWFQLE